MNNKYLAHVGIGMLEPVKKLVIVGIFDESIRGVEHKIHILAVGGRWR